MSAITSGRNQPWPAIAPRHGSPPLFRPIPQQAFRSTYDAQADMPANRTSGLKRGTSAHATFTHASVRRGCAICCSGSCAMAILLLVDLVRPRSASGSHGRHRIRSANVRDRHRRTVRAACACIGFLFSRNRAWRGRARRMTSASSECRDQKLGIAGSRGAPARVPGSAGRPDRPPRPRRPSSPTSTMLSARCRPATRALLVGTGSRCRCSNRATRRDIGRRHAHARPEDRDRRRRPLDRLARSAGARRKRRAEMQSVGRDVTDRVEAGSARSREARDQAETANRAKSRFLAMVSHEIERR